jgi:negative regulator of replication initiation
MKKSAKAYPRVLSKLNYRKAAFLKVTEKKHGHLVWLLAFSKAKLLKKPNQTHPKKITLSQRSWLENHFVCTVTNGKN